MNHLLPIFKQEFCIDVDVDVYVVNAHKLLCVGKEQIRRRLRILKGTFPHSFIAIYELGVRQP